MYATANKKMLNMLILDILEEYSDANHRLTQQEIIRLLKANYDMECDRRSVKNNILYLNELLGDVIDMEDGYYLAEPIDESLIDNKVHFHIKLAEMYAFRQYDVWSHTRADYPSDDYLLSQMAFIKKGKYTTIDPWVPEDENVPVVDHPFINHADKNSGYNPFEIYGTQKMARFVEEIILRNKREENSKTRQEMMDEIEWYCRELDMPLPEGYPEEMSDSEMQKWITTVGI